MAETILSRYDGRTILAVGAHPDDIELGMGGTAARLARYGTRVVMAVASIPDRYEVRLPEARRSAAILGGELRFLVNHGCARVEDVKTYELAERLSALIDEVEPAALFSHGPADFHNDHRLLYKVCQEAQRGRALDFFCYHPTMCRPTEVDFRPQAYFDISETFPVKLAAVKVHKSQFSSRGLPTDFLVDLARGLGREAGLPYAEAMEVEHMILA